MKRYPVGLPQELVLSPVLFYIFINALEKEMSSLRIKFTDDTKLLDVVNTNQDREIIDIFPSIDRGKTEKMGMGRVSDQIYLYKYVREGFMSQMIIMRTH